MKVYSHQQGICAQCQNPLHLIEARIVSRLKNDTRIEESVVVHQTCMVAWRDGNAANEPESPRLLDGADNLTGW
jgi:hypothetical protein